MPARDVNELDTLMLRAGARDEAAFRHFYELTAPALLSFLLRMLKDRFHAEDVLQDTMVIAWNKASEFDPALASAKTWITTIARRRALDLLRSRKRRDTVLHDDAEGIRDVFGLNQTLSAAAPESNVTVRRLAVCFDRLNQDAAACIRLAYLDGLTFAEIAASVDRSLGTVKSWVRRGMAKLQECMHT